MTSDIVRDLIEDSFIDDNLTIEQVRDLFRNNTYENGNAYDNNPKIEEWIQELFQKVKRDKAEEEERLSTELEGESETEQVDTSPQKVFEQIKEEEEIDVERERITEPVAEPEPSAQPEPIVPETPEQTETLRRRIYNRLRGIFGGQ